MALADARPDGTVHIYTHNQNPQALRGEIAQMLGTPSITSSCARSPAPATMEDRTAGTPARKTKRSFCRRPWASRCACSGCGPRTSSGPRNRPRALRTSKIGLDANGKMVAYQIDHYMPAMQDDRPVGAVLAGLPTMPAPDSRRKGVLVGSTVNDISDPWIYDGVPL